MTPLYGQILFKLHFKYEQPVRSVCCVCTNHPGRAGRATRATQRCPHHLPRLAHLKFVGESIFIADIYI